MEVSVELAYIDPGSGMLILQMLMAAILGAVFYMRQKIGRAVAWFRGTPAEPSTPEPGASTAPEAPTQE